MGIFSTRELALIIWFLILFFIFLRNKGIRESIKNIVGILLSKHIIASFFVILAYMTFLIKLFKAKFKIGKYISLKEVIIWVIFSGVPLCYGIVNEKLDGSYVRRIILNNIKFIIFIEFLIDSFPFSFIVEISILPIISILILVEVISSRKDQYKNINKISSFILGLLGLFIFIRSIILGICNYKELGSVESLVSFTMPLVLTVLYIPIIFIFKIWSSYNNIFYRLKTNLYFKLKSIKNNVVRKGSTYDYYVEKVEDVSTGVARRKSLYLILKENYDIEDLKNICIEQLSVYSFKNDVVWIYIATSEESYIVSNWIMRAQWISSKLDKRNRPSELNGIKEDSIYIDYNEKSYEVEEYYNKNMFKDDRVLFMENFKLYYEVFDIAKLFVELFKNGEFNKFKETCHIYEGEINNIYFKYGDIGFSTNIEFEEYLQNFQDYILYISNIVLYALDDSRSKKNKIFLINKLVKDIEDTIYKIESEKKFWLNKLNISVDEYKSLKLPK